ncbi:bacteriohemerythrin [Paramagnetospirillum magneticum]|uniref:Hemerythrin-like protein PA1673 n=1 Tax=Paramagnetospirillum magneticum (strain ATCC 700264 / AMB-1) TaxID=342108 RepID=Q2VYX0_PARM1|nr:hemerythrin family protein [Paramagnetospirillum magneticum]BAE53205.1 Hemerythrin-like protein PA1673 [Paramagnetospirillum magneticum AMB-1]
MTIAWREAMSVGDETIDADHRHLVDMINVFEAAVVGKIDHKRVARVLLGLVEYTGAHFKREEEIQVLIRYPYHDSHRHGHRDVLKQLTGIAQQYTQATGTARDEMIRGLGGFLREWLVDHIIQSDLRMKPYVLKYQAETQDAKKRQRAAVALSEQIAGVGH